MTGLPMINDVVFRNRWAVDDKVKKKGGPEDRLSDWNFLEIVSQFGNEGPWIVRFLVLK